MFVSTVALPEPYLSCLAGGRFHEVCDAEAKTAEALFGRALARVAVGSVTEARGDFDAATSVLQDACRVELALLDLLDSSRVKKALAEVQAVVQRSEGPSVLAARALHVMGLAQGKLRRTSEATDSLLRAAEMYSTVGERLGQAQVYDSLGMTEAARGRLDFALYWYSLSLVDKVLLGDRLGIAITVGNIGRVQLRAGRFTQALYCFRRDLDIAVQLGDSRGQCRMYDDIGRTHLGLEEYDEAEEALRKCLALAERGHFSDMVFFAHKDLALVHIAEKRLDDAEAELTAAGAALSSGKEGYLSLTLDAAKGEYLLSKGRPEEAVDLLSKAAGAFERAQLPDMEISTRISLAKGLAAMRLKASAEQCILRGLRLARTDGYTRYIPALNGAMAALELVEGAVDERARTVAEKPGRSGLETSYIVRERLGSGSFGDVQRVYDPERATDVALKRLRLRDLYDVKVRRQILASARVEIEAGSRVRHPGVARVYAIGSEPDGGSYVVQEFIRGKSLRKVIAKQAGGDACRVITCLERLASALEALHGAGVVHRDIKPDNIILREGDMPVLIDFGVAYMLGMQKAHDERIAGSLPYMSPEQALGRKIDGRADIYSLGVTAYEWLTGKLPFTLEGSTIYELALDIARRPVVPLSQRRPDITPDVDRLISSMLAKKPADRPKSASAVVAACRAILKTTSPARSVKRDTGRQISLSDTKANAKTRKLRGE